MVRSHRLHVWLVVALLPIAQAGFYALPGVTPHNFEEGDDVDLKVARIDSVKTQMPFPYYALPFCQPEERVHSAQQLGASLRGDRIEMSPYKLSFEQDEACKILCKKSYTEAEIGQFKEKVLEGYRAYWLVDNLPVATKIPMEAQDEDVDLEGDSYAYERGYEIGQVVHDHDSEEDSTPGEAYIYNHIRLTVKYHKQPEKPGARIVAFEAEPFSVQHRYKSWAGAQTSLTTCKPLTPVNHNMAPQKLDKATEIVRAYPYL
jgi:transmembrane 9 superfamily protein 2/4